MRVFKSWHAFAIASASFFLCMTSSVESCSRLMYSTPENNVIIGRSMDWMENIQTDLWAFPAGMTREGGEGTTSAKWTSKYGSIIASGYNMGTTDGFNTQGLDANLLYLSSADYGKPSAGQSTLSVLHWAQYVLDNYATVEEVVKGFEKNQFHMIAPMLPNGFYPGVHLSVGDISGDNAIFEFVNGKLVVYHSPKYTVMTNEPTFDKQLALNDYWNQLKGCFLPGTTEPSDRFVRASYYLTQTPVAKDEREAIAIVFSIVRNVSQPFMKPTPNRPNQATTIWRSVADLKRRVYYFEETNRPNVFWVDQSKLDLKSGAPVKKLPLTTGQVYAGEVSSSFVQSKPF